MIISCKNYFFASSRNIHGIYIRDPNMPISLHSHSGQFCGHAENTLEEVVQTAVSMQMDLYALTEHMPREKEDLYPEEVKASSTR